MKFPENVLSTGYIDNEQSAITYEVVLDSYETLHAGVVAHKLNWDSNPNIFQEE